MKTSILSALIIVGVTLLVWGVDAYKSADSDLARFFTGSATDASMGMVVCGVVSTLIGAGGFLRRPKPDRNS